MVLSLKPLPDSETLKLFYQKQYYEEHKNNISPDDKDIKYWEIVFSDRIRNFQYFQREKLCLILAVEQEYLWIAGSRPNAHRTFKNGSKRTEKT